MKKIRKGDLVAVLSGKDAGKTGKVVRVIDAGKRVVVEQANMHKHHVKAQTGARESGIVKKEAPLDISNVALVSPTTGKPVRVGFDFVVDAKGERRKVRIVHKTGEVLDQV